LERPKNQRLQCLKNQSQNAGRDKYRLPVGHFSSGAHGSTKADDTRFVNAETAWARSIFIAVRESPAITLRLSSSY